MWEGWSGLGMEKLGRIKRHKGKLPHQTAQIDLESDPRK